MERKVEPIIRNLDGSIGERSTYGHGPAASPAHPDDGSLGHVGSPPRPRHIIEGQPHTEALAAGTGEDDQDRAAGLSSDPARIWGESRHPSAVVALRLRRNAATAGVRAAATPASHRPRWIHTP